MLKGKSSNGYQLPTFQDPDFDKWFFEDSFQQRKLPQLFSESSEQIIPQQKVFIPEAPKKTYSEFNTEEMSMFIFQERNPKKQNKNTPRFLARLAIKYLKEYKDQYPSEVYDKVVDQCVRLEEWHKEDKGNVYLITDLEFLFTNAKKFGKEGIRLNRKVFRKILQREAKQELENPKSQVKKNKMQYYRACKIYSLRCMCKSLVIRNQTK